MPPRPPLLSSIFTIFLLTIAFLQLYQISMLSTSITTILNLKQAFLERVPYFRPPPPSLDYAEFFRSLSCPSHPRTIEEDVSYYLGSSVDGETEASQGGEIQTVDSWDQVKQMDMQTPYCFNPAPLSQSISSSNYLSQKWSSMTLDPRYLYTTEFLTYASLPPALPSSLVAIFGDSTSTFNLPSLLRKVRSCDSPGDGIIYKAESWRHFDPYVLADTAVNDVIPWREKIDKAVWRGATTGWPYPSIRIDDLISDPGPYHSRAELIRRIPMFSDSPFLDVAVSRYVQDVPSSWGIGSHLSNLEMSGYKMIVIAEGNDVATGSKWAMLSSSTMVTTKPRICSWLMEDMMEPGVHYLQVEEDFSDLEEKAIWCIDNEEECEHIGKMGRCWMSRFLNLQREEQLLSSIFNKASSLQANTNLCPT